MNGILLGQTKGSDTIVFLYDEKANRYGFDYNGTKYYYCLLYTSSTAMNCPPRRRKKPMRF